MRKKKILIVEDETGIRMALEDDFLLEGYDVDVAEDLQQLRRDLKKKPSLAPHTRAYLQRWQNGL